MAVALVACGGCGSDGADSASTAQTPTGSPTTGSTAPTPGETVPEAPHSAYRVSPCLVTDGELGAHPGYEAYPPIAGTVVGQGAVDHEGLVSQGWSGGCVGEPTFLTVLADDGTTWHFGWGSALEPLPWSDLPVSPGERVEVTFEGWSGFSGGAFGLFVVADDELRFAMRQSSGGLVTGVEAVDAVLPDYGSYRELYQLGACNGPLIFERWSLSLDADSPLEIEPDAVATGTLDGRPLEVLNAGVWLLSPMSGYCIDMSSGSVAYVLRVEATP